MSKSGDSARSRTRSKGALCFEVDDSDGGRRRVRLANNIDPQYDDSMTNSEPDSRAYEDALPALPGPGTGSEDDRCGNELALLFCPDCGSTEDVERSCRRSRCPHSWQSWDFHRAKPIAAKTAAQDAYRNSFSNSYKHHLVVSMANIGIRFNSSDPLNRGFETVKRLMDEVNVSSGYIIYHPYRIVEEYRGEVKGHDSGDGDMNWADILAKIEGDNWTWEAIKSEFLSFEPHFHVICTSEFVQGGAVTRKIEEKTGIVVKRITKPHPNPDKTGKVSIYGEEDLCKVSMYCLSHCGVEYVESSDQWRAAYRPFGAVANRTPSPGIEALIDETMRDVSEDVLGVAFPELRCSNEVLDEDETESTNRPAKQSVTNNSTTTSAASTDCSTSTPRQLSKTYSTTNLPSTSEWADGHNTGFSDDQMDITVQSEPVPDYAFEVPESATETCGSSLRPVHQARPFLEGDEYAEWRSNVSRGQLKNLRDTLYALSASGLSEPSMPPEPPPLTDE